MAKEKTPRFILNLKCYATSVEKVQLVNIFEQCRSLYNYMLNETLKRFESMHQSKLYQKNKRCLFAVLKKMHVIESKIQVETDKKKLRILKKEQIILSKQKTKLYKRTTGYHDAIWLQRIRATRSGENTQALF